MSMYPSEDDKFYSEKDEQEMITVRIKVTFYIDVEIPKLDSDKVDSDDFIKEAVNNYDYLGADSDNWEWIS